MNMPSLPYHPKSVTLVAEFEAIEAAAREAFGPAHSAVLRTAIQDQHSVLVALNTGRKYGHYGILEFNRYTKVLHTGHYFDSVEEATQDFKDRDRS